MRSNRISALPAVLVLAAVGLMAYWTQPDPHTGASLAWGVAVGWSLAAAAVAALIRIAAVRAARIAVAVLCLPACLLLATLGGLLLVPATLALIAAAILAPGRRLAVAARPAAPGPWTPAG